MNAGRASWTRRAVGRLKRLWWSGVLPLGRLPLLRALRGAQLRRLRPLANGAARGTPIVRYYWQRFLDAHRSDVRGRCLEVGSAAALKSLSRAVDADVLDVAHREGVSIVADLSRADHVPSDTYDCFIVPFTMHLIHDTEAALYHALRLLKPGGVLLVNFPCVDYYFPDGLDMGTGAPLFVHWWFTPIHVENLLRGAGLDARDYQLTIDGNVFARVAYQMNLPAEEMSAEERDYVDRGQPLLISVRVVRPEPWSGRRPEYRDAWLPSSTPAPWTERWGHYTAGS